MPKAPRMRKPAETVRTKTQTASKKAAKPRRLRAAATKAATPAKTAVLAVARLFRPLRFLLWPFKTRPVRFIGRVLASILLLSYVRNSWREVRQVTWPTRRETRQLTTAVFVFAIVFSTLITVVDYGLDKVFKQLLLN